MSGTPALVIGAFLEFVGILLIAWPDLIPHAERLSRGLRHAADRLRLAAGRPRTQTIGPSGIPSAEDWGHPGVHRFPPAGATADERIAFLLEEVDEAKRQIHRLADEVKELATLMQNGLAAVRADTREHTSGEIAMALARFRELRIAGAICLALGLVLTTTANFA